MGEDSDCVRSERPRDTIAMAGPAHSRPTQVLVVDDEPQIVTLICEGLSLFEMDPTPAGTVVEAIRKLDRTAYDVVVTDLRLPGEDGRTVLAQARRNPSGPEVVVLTGTGDVSTAVECMRMGAFDYILKPIDIQAVARIVKSAAEKRRFMLESRSLREVIVRSKYALMQALAERDSYTYIHCVNVAALAKAFAEHLSAPQQILDAITTAGELHDVGKIGVADHILNKPGPLTAEEFDAMRTHPSKGRKIVDPIGTFPDEGALVHSHHERWNGSGYPQGLAGEQIPFIARLAAIVDVFDAVTTDRPYRGAVSLVEAESVLRRGQGTDFEGPLVDEFLLFLEARFSGDDGRYREQVAEMRTDWLAQQ